MAEARLTAKGLTIDGRYVPYLGGEYQYFRNSHLYWEPTLDMMKEAGLLFVSSFICWDFHELTPGEFDFDGSTYGSRNLRGFLDACAERDLYVVARPGPIIDAEWYTRGPARDVMTLERLDPRFLARTSQWLAAVGDVLAPYQITEGGPVVFVVFDNTVLFPYVSDPEFFDNDGDVLLPYHEDVALGMYAEWLEGKYGTVSKLSEAWGASLGAFSEIRTPPYGRGANPRQVIDSFAFINDRIKTYIDWGADQLYQAGIRVPTTTTQRLFTAYVDLPRAAAAVDATGAYFTAPNLLHGDQLRTLSWWARLQSAHHDFFWAPEFQAGWIGLQEEYGFISVDHDRYMTLLGLAFGIRGLSWFMFVERDDWSWSPINTHAKPRPNRLRQYEGLAAIIKQLDPTDAQLADIGLIWTLEEHQLHAAALAGDWTDLFKIWVNFDAPKEAELWWSAFTSLEDQDLDFVLYDPRGTKPPPAVLIWAGSHGMAEEVARRIAADVETGSKLITLSPLQETTPGGEPSDTVQAMMNRIRASGRFHQAEPDKLMAVIEKVGAARYVSTEGNGLLSFAYRGAAAPTIFVINNRSEVAAVRLEIAASVTAEVSELGDLWPWPDAHSEAVAHDGGLSFELRPKSVRILRPPHRGTSNPT